MKSRRGFAMQRLMNAMRQAHADGWVIVFDTLTLADVRFEAFYVNAHAVRDYFRGIDRMVLTAEGRKANDSHVYCYQYFCVTEYGTANGRLHFHAVHFMRSLPTGSVDPNFGRRVRNRRQLNSLQNTWPYGYSFFFQAEDGIRDKLVTGVQTCALPISSGSRASKPLLNPNCPPLIDIAPGETRRKFSASRFWANLSAAFTTSVVCQ